jgi:hypothetical protein
MIDSFRDPAAMTPAERLAELAVLLGAAYLRLLVARRESRNCLEHAAESEPSCAPVNGGESPPRKERA